MRGTSGLTPEEVKIQVEIGVLTISGEHQEEEEQDERYLRRERAIAPSPGR